MFVDVGLIVAVNAGLTVIKLVADVLVSGATGTFEYYISVTDAHPTTVDSSNAIIIVNSALLAKAITPSNPTIDSGQSITLTANPSGGTTPYSYQWYSGTSSTCSSDTAISGATSSTYSASPTSSTYYCYVVTDSATTPETNTSATNLITVNPALTATISPTSTNTYTYLTTTMSNITYSSSFSNMEFYYPSNNTIIPSWIESNSSGNLTIWLNISAGIPASTNETVDMGLSNSTTNMLNNSTNGEAPRIE